MVKEMSLVSIGIAVIVIGFALVVIGTLLHAGSQQKAGKDGSAKFSFVGFIGPSVRADLHASDMTKGLLKRTGIEPEATVGADQLREAARAWLRRSRTTRPSLASLPPLRPSGTIASAPGSASPYVGAAPSNSRLVSDFPNPIPSGEGYVPESDPFAVDLEAPPESLD